MPERLPTCMEPVPSDKLHYSPPACSQAFSTKEAGIVGEKKPPNGNTKSSDIYNYFRP